MSNTLSPLLLTALIGLSCSCCYLNYTPVAELIPREYQASQVPGTTLAIDLPRQPNLTFKDYATREGANAKSTDRVVSWMHFRGAAGSKFVSLLTVMTVELSLEETRSMLNDHWRTIPLPLEPTRRTTCVPDPMFPTLPACHPVVWELNCSGFYRKLRLVCCPVNDSLTLVVKLHTFSPLPEHIRHADLVFGDICRSIRTTNGTRIIPNNSLDDLFPADATQFVPRRQNKLSRRGGGYEHSRTGIHNDSMWNRLSQDASALQSVSEAVHRFQGSVASWTVGSLRRRERGPRTAVPTSRSRKETADGDRGT